MNNPDTTGGAVQMTSFGSVQISSSKLLMPMLALLMALFMAMPLQAAVAPDAGSAGSQTTSFLNISGPIVVQPCANITLGGSLINASNVTDDPLDSYNVTVVYNSTHNASANVTGLFALNITAPCTSSNGVLQNLTVYTNSSDNHSKTLHFYVSNATNVSITLLTQKPPFALGTNNTVNVSYFNASTPLSGNKPYLVVYNSKGQRETADVQLYNLTSATNAQGIIQYNISVASTASGTYALVVDYGLSNFVFATQAAYGVSLATQSPSGEGRSSFAPISPVNIVAKTRYANGTAFTVAGSDYVTAFVTLPNTTIYELNLTAADAETLPGVNNKTFTVTNQTGMYKLRIIAHLQGEQYETFGQFETRTGVARLEPDSGAFQHAEGGRATLPGATIQFNVLLYNNSDDSLVAGAQNGGPNVTNCSAIVLNSFTDVNTGTNVSWTGTLAKSVVPYAGVNICAISIGLPNTAGDYRVNATLVDPANDSRRIDAEGFVPVRNYGPFMRICNAVSDIMECGGGAPSFQKNANVTLEFKIINFTSGQSLPRSAFNGILGINLRRFSFGIGAATENTNWVENTSFFLRYPQVDSSAIRIVLDLPDDNSTGPTEAEITLNTTVGTLKAREFFMVKGTSIETFAHPSGNQAGRMTCNGSTPFILEAFDMGTHNPVQGVRINGILGIHAGDGKAYDSTYFSLTTNTTDSTGQAAFNVTFNSSKNFTETFYGLLLNVSFQGNDDEAPMGFLCGSGNMGQVGPNGPGDRQGPAGPGGNSGPQQGGVTGFPLNQPPRVGSADAVNLPFASVGFGEFQSGPGNSGLNGTLRIRGLKFFNPSTGSERTIAAGVPLDYDVDTGAANVGPLFPANFSLNGWPQGFIMLQVNLTNGSTPGVGTGPSALGDLPGFESTPYRIFVDFNSLPGSVAVGENVSIILNVSSNVSTSGNNVTVRVRSMSANSQMSAALVSSVMLYDGWNSTANDQGFPPGAEMWNVTFTVPTIAAGPANFILVVNNSQGIINEMEIFGGRVSALEVRPLQGLLVQMQGGCIPLDDAGQNGTLSTCFPINFFGGGGPMTPYTPSEPGITNLLNFSALNVTYNVSSKSGQVCYKPAINWSIGFGPGAQTFSLSNDTYVALVDNLTSGVYDTVVLNNTQNNLTIVRMANLSSSHRNLNRVNTSFGGYYVLNPEGCALLRLVNGSESPSFGSNFVGLGRSPVNEKWYVAYRVFRGASAVPNAYVDYLGIGNLSLGSDQFQNMLTPSQFSARGSESNNQGVAFTELNISVPGEFMVFWKVNATINGQLVSTFAKLQRDEYSYGGGGGNKMEIASFNAFCMGFNPGITAANQNVSVNCTASYFNNTPIAGANFTLVAIDRSVFPSVQTTLRLFNVTTGADQPGVLSDGTGTAELKYAMPGGGWQTNRFYEIMGTAVFGDLTQQLHLGGVMYGAGGPGNFGPMGPGGS